MIIGFKKQFVPKILDGSKIHTIREDPHNRWEAGKKIHFATGVRTKNYSQFKEGMCKGRQRIIILPVHRRIVVLKPPVKFFVIEDMIQFAINDGFESEAEFWRWFDKPFTGVIVHWTDFRYT